MKSTTTLSIDQYKALQLIKKAENKKDRQKGQKAKADMGWLLVDLSRRLGLTLATEYRFDTERKWEADWALFGTTTEGKEVKITVEYEGLMSDKSGHTTIKGYSDNCAKYNRAAILGWVVLRYTAKNYSNLGRDLKDYLKQVNK